MDNNKNLGILITVFTAIILGVVLTNSLGNNVYANTRLSDISNESITMTATQFINSNESITIASSTGNVLNGSITNITFFGNGTNNTAQPTGTSLVVGLDVNFTRNGLITVGDKVGTTGVYNISYQGINKISGNTAQDDITNLNFFGNATINTYIAGIAVASQVNFTTGGTITASPYNFSGGTYNASYTYKGSQYVDDTQSRNILPLIIIFFAVAVFLAAVGLAWYLLRQNGFL